MIKMVERQPAAQKLLIAGFWLSLLALVGWLLSDAVSARASQQPWWDLGGAGDWVDFYARAIAAGSSMAAKITLAVAGLLLARDLLSRLAGAIGRLLRRGPAGA
ncbi:hypothetical protein [Streptomyces sp. NPDC006879]|uniref:hypothetical protein n=1 Tax=Streptomyces sp. NPDC006879 TaxID=3364767 RepID=UPI00367F3390